MHATQTDACSALARQRCHAAARLTCPPLPWLRAQVHRDVKLTNVLVSEDGTLRLADFGLAAFQGDGCFAGDESYVVPELAVRMPDGRRRRDNPDAHAALMAPAIDMWAVGVLAYELFAGSLPTELNYAAWQAAGRSAGLTPEAAEQLRLDAASTLDWTPYLARLPGMTGGIEHVTDFVARLVVADPRHRMTAHQALQHPCISGVVPAELAELRAMSRPGSAWQQQRARDVQLAGKVQRMVLRCQAALACEEELQAVQQEQSQLRQHEAMLQQELQAEQQVLQQQVVQRQALQLEVQQVQAQRQELHGDIEVLHAEVAEEHTVLQRKQAAALAAKDAAVAALGEEQQQLLVTEQEAAAAQQQLQEVRQRQAAAARALQEAAAAVAAIAEAPQQEQEEMQTRPASPQQDDAQVPAAAEQAAGAADPSTVSAAQGALAGAAYATVQQAEADVVEPNTPSRSSEGADLAALLSGSDDDGSASASDDGGSARAEVGPSRACMQDGRRQGAWWRRAAIAATHAISFLGATLDVQPVRRAGVPGWAA